MEESKLAYDNEIRSVQGPGAPASQQEVVVGDPMPVEVRGRESVSKGTLEDSARVRGCDPEGTVGAKVRSLRTLLAEVVDIFNGTVSDTGSCRISVPKENRTAKPV